MSDFSIATVSRVFWNANFTLQYIGQICESDDDSEAIEETACFLNMKWEDVSSEMLRKRFTAFSFFTETAFFLFLPSVIINSNQDSLNTHLAIDNIISTLRNSFSLQLNDFYQRRWRMFSAFQLDYIKEWIESPIAEFRGYFEPEDLVHAAAVLEQYSRKNSILEKSSEHYR